MQNSSLFDRKQLRKDIREKRRHLSPEEQRETGQAVAAIALSEDHFSLGEHIALFMSADGEVDTAYLIDALQKLGKACYLPVLEPESVTLRFRRYFPDTPLVTNFFGLLEPDTDAPVIMPRELSTVFMPLVGFDPAGNRLGMGMGYYDRTFAFKLQDRKSGPVLIGLAHECQRVENLEAADWDVPLEGIITGQGFYRAR